MGQVFRTADVDDLGCLFAGQMHDQVRGERRACRQGDDKMYPEDTELKEGPKCKMDNFRDLRIGSPALVVPPQSQLK